MFLIKSFWLYLVRNSLVFFCHFYCPPIPYQISVFFLARISFLFPFRFDFAFVCLILCIFILFRLLFLSFAGKLHFLFYFDPNYIRFIVIIIHSYPLFFSIVWKSFCRQLIHCFNINFIIFGFAFCCCFFFCFSLFILLIAPITRNSY